MTYPLKTLNQLSLLLRAFRKEKGLTQAAMAEKFGITQQSYAYFEANPGTAAFERLFMVLRLLDVEITLGSTSLRTGTNSKALDTVAIRKAKSSPARVIRVGAKKEEW